MKIRVTTMYIKYYECDNVCIGNEFLTMENVIGIHNKSKETYDKVDYPKLYINTQNILEFAILP